MRRSNHFSIRLLVCLLGAVFLLVTMPGCGTRNKMQKPTPTPAALPTYSIAEPLVNPSGGATLSVPGVATATAASSETGGASAATEVAAVIPTPGPSATLDPCPPPDGWVKHSIRQDETLYYLATSTGVTVEEVMKANCLATDLIQVGQVLSLPAIPPARPTFPPAPLAPAPQLQTPSTQAECPTRFSCSIASLPPLDLPAGMPGSAGYVPCNKTLPNPWISTDDDRRIAGERFYLFACDFTLPLDSAFVIFPDGSKLDLPTIGTIPDFPENVTGRLVEFPILPAYLPSSDDKPYQVTIVGGDGKAITKSFFINPFYQDETDIGRILVVPHVAPPGDEDGFTIYYINFPYQSVIDVELFGEIEPVEKIAHRLSGRAAWKITIDQPMPGSPEKDGAPLKGWAVETIHSDASDDPAGYAIVYRINEDNKLSALFWLR